MPCFVGYVSFYVMDELDECIFIVTVSRTLSDFIICSLNEFRRISNNSRILDVIARDFVVVLSIDDADATIGVFTMLTQNSGYYHH